MRNTLPTQPPLPNCIAEQLPVDGPQISHPWASSKDVCQEMGTDGISPSPHTISQQSPFELHYGSKRSYVWTVIWKEGPLHCLIYHCRQWFPEYTLLPRHSPISQSQDVNLFQKPKSFPFRRQDPGTCKTQRILHSAYYCLEISNQLSSAISRLGCHGPFKHIEYVSSIP
ncbi:hypothetical protein KC19_7G090600, partial [Ceratodon purpureus]